MQVNRGHRALQLMAKTFEKNEGDIKSESVP